MEKASLTELPTQDDFPDDGGVILYENFYDRLYLNSNYDVRVEKQVQRAIIYFNDKAETWTHHVIYLDDQSILLDFTAYTQKPNGEIIYLTKEDLHPTHVNESLQKVSHEKSLRFVFPGVEPGAILYYGYTINRKGFFSGDYWFIESSLPKIYSRFNFEIPRIFFRYNYDWNYSSFNFAIEEPTIYKNIMNQRSRKDASIIVYWERRDIPALEKEPFSPPYFDIAQYVSVDLKYDSWNELGKFYYGLIKNYVNHPDHGAVKKLSDEICAGATTQREKIDRIFQYAQREFRYLAFDFGESGIIPHTFSEIVRNKYGDCKDMSILQINLLKAQGIKAFPALVATKARTLDKPFFISLKNFDHMIVYVQADSGKVFWLDATGDICPLGEIYPSIEGQYALVLFDKGKAKFKRIPPSKCTDNIIRRIVNLTLDGNQKISGNAKLVYQGNPNIRIRSRLREASDEDFNKFVKSYVNSQAGDITISNLHYDDPSLFEHEMHIEFELSKDNFGSKLNKLVVFNPAIFKVESDLDKLVAEERKHPIYLGSPVSIVDEVHIRFDPTQYSVEGLFETISCIKPFGSFLCKVKKEGDGHIVYQRIYKLSKGLIPKQAYSDLKELEKSIAYAAEQNLALKKL
ncbi:DUF3857 domain-containing protein [Calditrichota bacterium LG25]